MSARACRCQTRSNGPLVLLKWMKRLSDPESVDRAERGRNEIISRGKSSATWPLMASRIHRLNNGIVPIGFLSLTSRGVRVKRHRG